MPEELEVAQINPLYRHSQQLRSLSTCIPWATEILEYCLIAPRSPRISSPWNDCKRFKMRHLILFLFIELALTFAITPFPAVSNGFTATASFSTSPTPSKSITHLPATTSVTQAHSQMPVSAVVTIAPLVANPLERRQRCWNDQGFSVDCATWTGYYYTWGPPGNPYEGGPGEGEGSGGSNGGNGGGTVVVYQSDSSRLDLTSWSAIFGLLGLGLLLFI